MFFPRLRRHAKWMFVLLALVFGVGFVVFGVGASGTGLGDLLRGGGSSSSDTPSIKDARKKLEKKPNDAAALRELAQALEADNQNDEAAQTLERYVALRPKDTEALSDLAGLYVAKARREQEAAQAAQAEAADLTAASSFRPQLDLGGGRTIGTDPLEEALNARASEIVTGAVTKVQTAFDQAKSAYQRWVTAAPRDPTAQLFLAQTAQQAGDNSTAIKAYKAYLKLAPDDPQADYLRQLVKQLQSSATTAAG